MLLRLTMLGCTNSLMDKEYGSFFMLKHSPEMKCFSYFLQNYSSRVHYFLEVLSLFKVPCSFWSLCHPFCTSHLCLEEESEWGGLQEILSGGTELRVRHGSTAYKAGHLSFQTPQGLDISCLSAGGSRHFWWYPTQAISFCKIFNKTEIYVVLEPVLITSTERILVVICSVCFSWLPRLLTLILQVITR